MKAIFLLALAVAGSQARPVQIERNDSALEFTYNWPAEAAAIPALESHMRTLADAALADARKFALEDEAAAKADEREFHQHYASINWETAGITPRLLSLRASIDTFTGGAHPNHGFAALLWDRHVDKEVRLASLFVNADAMGSLMRSRYCAALDEERLKRRGEEKIGGQFDNCPKLSELAIGPSDEDRDGRFDQVDFVAAPYVAGPYVEGEYVVSLPVTRPFVAALKQKYRASFEVQRAQ